MTDDDSLYPGLYEQVINLKIAEQLDKVSAAKKHTAKIDDAEASKVLAQYISTIVQKGLDCVYEEQGDLSVQVKLANQIIDLIGQQTGENVFRSLRVAAQGQQLLALLGENNPLCVLGKKPEDFVRPETSVAQSSLFTGAVHEPQMFTELKKEIISADRIDMLVSFIKWSGLRLLWNELSDLTKNGGKLRVITTSYMGATDMKAIEKLSELPNTEVKISYDTKRTRLHAKTYIFERRSGFTTAYVGSSNLSNAAISCGLEWNVKVTKTDLPETMSKIEATFNSYWNATEFEDYRNTDEQHARLSCALKAERTHQTDSGAVYLTDVMPYPYQKEILDRLEAERTLRHRMRNLVVAATGTGKTVISALDYKRFCLHNPNRPCRLLFVAHREEILKQSLYTFRAVLKDADFGALFVGDNHPDEINHLFMSIQTFNTRQFDERTSADFYDFIIVDEFHHAAAASYQKLLAHYRPQILLGLTATPERMDGQSILPYFDNRIAAEIRLPEAVDRKLLCPFHYFGVTDTVNLDEVPWRHGGYAKEALSDLYRNSMRADNIIKNLIKYTTDPEQIKGLGFCVTVEHAEFMSRYFNEHNIPSICLTAQSSDEERKSAQKRLTDGCIRFIFVVDLYNEGVDIPQVNTILFLRPTESLTVFLQQLGRGLRLSENKECLTVLDFIGQANKKYNFSEKFAALLNNATRSVSEEIKSGFLSAPKGCFIQLEKVAEKYVLDNIKAAYGRQGDLLNKIEAFEQETKMPLTFLNFLKYYTPDLWNIYKFGTFSQLCAKSRSVAFAEPLENSINVNKAFARLAVIDSHRWILFLIDLLNRLPHVNLSALSDSQKRMFRMFYVTLWGKSAENLESDEVKHNLQVLADSPQLKAELTDLLRYRDDRIDFLDERVDVGFDCPLDLHCTYTRDQILIAMDFMTPMTVREGVKRLESKNIDVLFVTLNKADKEYSPTTMYQDYSINDTLFHWQSQSTTSAESPTGRRYRYHQVQKSKILLFVREYKINGKTGQTEPYTYLGTANYVQHEGSMPMNIVWRLEKPIPARFLKKTNKLLV